MPTPQKQTVSSRRHHLARHAVACFLTRGDLWLSWTHGAAVFERDLLDADWALNNFNWLWLAGVAPWSAPYFRVYSPIPNHKSSALNVDDADGAFVDRFGRRAVFLLFPSRALAVRCFNSYRRGLGLFSVGAVRRPRTIHAASRRYLLGISTWHPAAGPRAPRTIRVAPRGGAAIRLRGGPGRPGPRRGAVRRTIRLAPAAGPRAPRNICVAPRGGAAIVPEVGPAVPARAEEPSRARGRSAWHPRRGRDSSRRNIRVAPRGGAAISSEDPRGAPRDPSDDPPPS